MMNMPSHSFSGLGGTMDDELLFSKMKFGDPNYGHPAHPGFHQASGFGHAGIIDFGTMPEEPAKHIVFIPKERLSVNCLGILVSILFPWLLFTGLYWIMIFEVHYYHPTLAWSSIFASLGLATVLAIIAGMRKKREAEPSWHTYAALAFFLATCLAAFLGNIVFWADMKEYYDYQTLNTYTSIDPSRHTGQMTMDAGRIYFSDGVELDQKKAMSFKHGDTYCVVPITQTAWFAGTSRNPATYDFWAVGTNCCSENHKFECGDFNNQRIRSGIRSMDIEQSPFFRLAVQQAEAAYGIKALHPVFFHWTQDPLGYVNERLAFGVKYFLMGISTYFIFNFTCVIYAVFSFAKM